MAPAPMSNAIPRTACTVCCQCSLTSLHPCGTSGSDMIFWSTARSLAFAPGGEHGAAESRGTAILARPARLFHGTEDNVRGVWRVLLNGQSTLPGLEIEPEMDLKAC